VGIDADTFWINVKKEIKVQNTTAEWVAKHAGVSINTFNGWNRNGVFPRADDAYRIAASLNTSIEYLLTGNHGPRANKKTLEEISHHAHHIQDHLDAIRLYSDEVIE
jgi:transcriptional regulator with XRE-family HTH domain